MQQAGFDKVAEAGKTTTRTSPYTVGALFRAVKAS
jgi:hypothetical protein